MSGSSPWRVSSETGQVMFSPVAVMPFAMVAQGVSSAGPALAGCLNDLTGSYLPGMAVGAAVAAAGLILSSILARPLKGRLDQCTVDY